MTTSLPSAAPDRREGEDGAGTPRPQRTDRARERAPPRPPWRHRAGADRDPAATLCEPVILVDTAVWIDHLSDGDAHLAELLEHGVVLAHPWVTGELALGQLRGLRRDPAAAQWSSPGSDRDASRAAATHRASRAVRRRHRLCRRSATCRDDAHQRRDVVGPRPTTPHGRASSRLGIRPSASGLGAAQAVRFASTGWAARTSDRRSRLLGRLVPPREGSEPASRSGSAATPPSSWLSEPRAGPRSTQQAPPSRR